MQHTLVALVENQPGVLQRVANLFSRRGFNIESLTVGHTDTPKTSRMTIVVNAADTQVDQVTKQLYKLINVLKVSDVTTDRTVDRELALIKVNATASTRARDRAGRGHLSGADRGLGARFAHGRGDGRVREDRLYRRAAAAVRPEGDGADRPD